MHPLRSSLFTPLAILLAGGLFAQAGPPGPATLPKGALAQLRAQEPARVQTLQQHLLALRGDLGLGGDADFRVRSRSTDLAGATTVHFQQLHRGLPVWNGQVVATLDAQGRRLAPTASVFTGVAVETRAAVSQDQAVRRALEHAKVGSAQLVVPASARLVVFPTVFQDGLKFTRDPGTGHWAIDHRFSVATEPCADPYRLAYRVSLRYRTPGDPYQARDFIIDAGTGSMLKAWDGLQHAGHVPIKGTGHSQYSGTVVLDAAKDPDTGEAVLKDLTRGTLPHPWAAYFPDQPLLTTPGILTAYLDGLGSVFPHTNPDETTPWGDGTQFVQGEPLNGPNGQTAAVDAHHGLATTWDFLAKVFGREGGLDGQGTSPMAFTHLTGEYGEPVPNASYDPENMIMRFGDGGMGFTTFTSLDVVAHELCHGLCVSTANLDYAGESGGLNEANSDILGALTTFWARGGDRSTGFIPDAGGTWTIGDQLSATPIRTLYKPSIDGYTFDVWFDGLDEEEVHDASGVGSRFFYFLAMGTGPDADRTSPYLPGGMAGIGNDKAGRIWFQALTQHMTPETDYHGAREATLLAAEALYGRTSAAFKAVGDAWTAVNVNPASVRVRVPRAAGTGRRWLVPSGASTQLVAEVSNATDPTCLWSGGANGYFNGGRLAESGLFTAPRTGGNGYGVTVKSRQDPLQHASGVVWVANLDCDNDLDGDACDLGTLALNHMNGMVRNSGADLTNDLICDDLDLFVWTRTFATAYGK